MHGSGRKKIDVCQFLRRPLSRMLASGGFVFVCGAVEVVVRRCQRKRVEIISSICRSDDPFVWALVWRWGAG